MNSPNDTRPAHAADLAALVTEMMAAADQRGREEVAARLLATIATLKAMRPSADAETSALTSAAAGLFDDLAARCVSVQQLFLELIDEPESADAICMAGAALAEKMGYIADNAAFALSPSSRQRDDDEWLLTPRGQQDMATLRAARAQGGAA